jgi:hypothetical protein
VKPCDGRVASQWVVCIALVLSAWMGVVVLRATCIGELPMMAIIG